MKCEDRIKTVPHKQCLYIFIAHVSFLRKPMKNVLYNKNNKPRKKKTEYRIQRIWGSNIKAKRIPWMMMNSSHKKTALQPTEEGIVPIKAEGTGVSKVVFLREKTKRI